MTSHIHMIIGSNKDKLEDIMRDMKRHTSEKLKEAIKSNPVESRRECPPDPVRAGMLWMMENAGKKNSNNINFQLWHQDNHPIELTDDRHCHSTLDYIHENPDLVGIVEKAEDYLYSSARNYFGLKGMIDVILFEPRIM